jgi:hypothetical protein
MPSLKGWSVMLLAGAIATACAGKQEVGEAASVSGVSELTLVVRNYNFNDATLYAVGAGRRERLGRVTGNGEERFTFRWTNPDLRVVVDFLAGRDETTDAIPVAAGDVLELVIEQSTVRPLRRMR